MSADNWGPCPQCVEAEASKRKEVALKAGQSYGKVPPEKFLAMLEAIKVAVDPEDTLREDYEIGIDKDGKFYVSYSGFCHVCKFEFKYKHDQQVWPEKKK